MAHASLAKRTYSGCVQEMRPASSPLASFEPRAPQRQLQLRVLTHNIRYATSSPQKNEKPWRDRKALIASQFLYHTRFLDGRNLPQQSGTKVVEHTGASFICMQEVLHDQLRDILASLNHANKGSTLCDGPYWSHVGVAREDGKTEGEYCPVLYPTMLFNLLHFENTWLSPTPEKPSKGWGAGCIRILTTGVFEHKLTKQRVAVFNTHLDHASSEAREKGVGVILKVIDRVRAQWASESELNYFLAGDFNSFPTQEAYKAVLASDKMVDAHDAVVGSARYGNETTFTGFQPDTDTDRDEIGRIDYIWFGPKSRIDRQDKDDPSEPGEDWDIQGYAVLPNVFDDGIFSSDHRCVVTDAVLRQKPT